MNTCRLTAIMLITLLTGCHHSPTPPNRVDGSFERTGKAEAATCKNYVLFSTCEIGQIEEPYPTRFERVYEFNNGKRCFFNTNGESVTFSDGKIAIPQYVTFACRKAN